MAFSFSWGGSSPAYLDCAREAGNYLQMGGCQRRSVRSMARRSGSRGISAPSRSPYRCQKGRCHEYRRPGPDVPSRNTGRHPTRGQRGRARHLPVDAVLDYPQSGERFRGRAAISAQTAGTEPTRHFTVLRIRSRGSLWVSECTIHPSTVGPHTRQAVMELASEAVAHETQYFADPFGAPPWRIKLAEPMPGRSITTLNSVGQPEACVKSSAAQAADPVVSV